MKGSAEVQTFEQFMAANPEPVWESISDQVEEFVIEADLGYSGYIAESDPESGKSPFNSEGLLPVLLIAQGWSKNKRYGYNEKGEIIEIGRYYTNQAIHSLKEFLDHRTAVYANHEMPWGPPRVMEDWAAEIKSWEIKDVGGKAQATAELKMVPTHKGEMMMKVIEAFPSKVGMSIMGNVSVRRGKIAGREADIVEKFADMISNDFVRYPGMTGAGIRRGKESADSNGIRDIKVEKDSSGRIHFVEFQGRKYFLSQESFESEIPVVREPVLTVSKEDDSKVPNTTFENAHQMYAAHKEHVDQILAEAKAGWERDNKSVQETAALKSECEGLKSQVRTLTEQNATLKADLDKVQTAQALVQRKEKVRSLLREAQLNVEDTVHCSPIFIELLEAQADEARVKSMIEDRKALVFSNNGQGNGARKTETPVVDNKPTIEAKTMTSEEKLTILLEGRK